MHGFHTTQLPQTIASIPLIDPAITGKLNDYLNSFPSLDLDTNPYSVFLRLPLQVELAIA